MSRSRGSLAVVVFVAAGVFLPSVGGEFLNYDDDQFRASRPIRDADLATILDPRASRAELGSEYLPVRDLSYVLDARLFGTREQASIGYRASNLAWYGLTCALAYAFLSRLLRDSALAFLAAVLFAAHPVHAESVAWIASRKDLVSGAFLFLALNLQLWSRGRGRRARALAVAAGTLAMLSKSTALALPLLVALVEAGAPALRRSVARLRGNDERAALDDQDLAPLAVRLGRAIGHAVAAGIVLANAIGIATSHGIAQAAPPGGMATTLATDATIVARYVEIAFVPNGLRASYAWPLRTSFVDRDVLVALASIALVPAMSLVVARCRSRAGVAFTWTWFLLALAPALNLVPWVQWIAERYLFIPLLGPCLLLGWLIEELRAWSPRGGLVVAALLVSAFGFEAGTRGLEFTSSVRLWRSNVAVEPENPVARHHLANANLRKAAKALTRGARSEGLALAREAEADERRALEIYARPGVFVAGHATEARVGIAIARDLRGDAIGAVEIAIEAVDHDSRDPNALRILVALCERVRDTPSAGGALLAHAARGFARLGRGPDARATLETARTRDPAAADSTLARDVILRGALEPHGSGP